MKKQDYNAMSTDILLTIMQMKLDRPTTNMEEVSEIRNIIKQRRIDAVKELKKLLNVEAAIQRLVTHHLKNKTGV